MTFVFARLYIENKKSLGDFLCNRQTILLTPPTPQSLHAMSVDTLSGVRNVFRKGFPKKYFRKVELSCTCWLITQKIDWGSRRRGLISPSCTDFKRTPLNFAVLMIFRTRKLYKCVFRQLSLKHPSVAFVKGMKLCDKSSKIEKDFFVKISKVMVNQCRSWIIGGPKNSTRLNSKMNCHMERF